MMLLEREQSPKRRIGGKPGPAFKSRSFALFILPVLVFISLGACNEPQKKDEGEAPGDASYTLQQQVFCLNMLSNIGDSYNGSDSSQIQSLTAAAVNKVLNSAAAQSFIGSWQCIWGPVVNVGKDKIKTKSGGDSTIYVANNAMFIAHKTGTNIFVVAIAGTDPASKFEWGYEDLDVVPIAWDLTSLKKGYVTTATKTGLAVLSLMASNDSLAQQVLAKRATSMNPIQIWVTGHSLGGALAPAYALYLHDNFGKWAPNTQPVVNCLAVAGATPGDASFNAYYASQLGSTTTRVWNTRDVVPHGFESDMLARVPNLYPSDSVSAFPDSLRDTLAALEIVVKPFHYTQFHPADSFTSAIYTSDSLHILGNISDTSFLGQALFQHIPAYGVYFGTLGFQQAVQQVMGMKAPFFTEGAILVGINSSGVGRPKPEREE